MTGKMQAIYYVDMKKVPHLEQTLVSLLMHKNKGEHVHSKLVKQMETQQKYWHTPLEWIIKVVRFLAEWDLSFLAVMKLLDLLLMEITWDC